MVVKRDRKLGSKRAGLLEYLRVLKMVVQLELSMVGMKALTLAATKDLMLVARMGWKKVD